jgi:leucyl aminopeptidase
MNIDLKFINQDYSKNVLIFCDQNFNSINIDTYFSPNKALEIIKNIKNAKSLDKNLDCIIFNINPNQKIVAVKILKNYISSDIEKKGAQIYEFLKKNNINEINLLEKNINSFSKNNSFIDEFIFGVKLKSYEFNKYKSKNLVKKISIFCPKKLSNKIYKKQSRFFSLLEGTNLTKDLVSEPGNVLHPDEYVRRINSLKKLGLKINIYNKKKLKKLGMNALLGVGQGSARGSYLVTIEWNGTNKKNNPLAFVGKGVCFDTGGISLKPAKFMEDMTYDMAGSAVVVGLMKTLALRKAKVNAVGVVGLVENMPDGNAQRPGDIVKSYSGKTIEILNTDAEGRLVLADALTYTEKKFKPKFIIDLATLTGAIIVSLGSEYAGLFSNDDKISDQLSKAGEKVGEKVWRMPLNENYDKLINSKKADMQNINYVGGAGSTTAAQFLQRFIINKTPWAHLDIAGMAFSKYGGALNSEGATGYGVRLLNQLIEDNYE